MDAMQLLHAILHIDQYMAALVSQYGTAFYLLLFVIVFCETGFVPLFFLPGNPLLFICGAFSSTGAMNLWVLLATLIVATISGRTVNYWTGRAIGKSVFTHDYAWLNRAALNRTHAFCEKYGGVTMIISPFIAVIRTFAPFVAGVSTMDASKFQLFNVLGAVIWVAVLVVGGNLFGNIPVIHDHMNAIVLIGVVTGLTALVLAAGWKIYRGRSVK
jgi:membrane-associated protein